MNRSTEVLTQRNVEAQDTNGAVAPAKNGPKTILLGWDKQRTYTFIVLAVCFVIWACVFFPLLLKNNENSDDDDADGGDDDHHHH